MATSTSAAPPEWEKARKALEAVQGASKTSASPQKDVKQERETFNSFHAPNMYPQQWQQQRPGFFPMQRPQRAGFNMYNPYNRGPSNMMNGGFRGPMGMANGQINEMSEGPLPRGPMPMMGPRQRPPLLPGFGQPRGGPRPFMPNKQSPGSGGIRFNLPKRIQQGNAFSNYQQPKKMSAKEEWEQQAPQPANKVPANNTTPAREQPEGLAQNKQQEQTPGSPTPPPDPGAKAAAGEWPPSLKSYVQRAFGSADDEISKDIIEKALKERLTQVFNDGSAYTVDWDKEPLPCALLRKAPPQQHQRGRGHGKFRNQRGSMRDRYFSNRRSRSRSRSRSYSRSRSRSRSPAYRRNRPHRRRFSSGSEESDSDSSYSSYGSVQSRLGKVRGRGRGRGRGQSTKKKKVPTATLR